MFIFQEEIKVVEDLVGQDIKSLDDMLKQNLSEEHEQVKVHIMSELEQLKKRYVAFKEKYAAYLEKCRSQLKRIEEVPENLKVNYEVKNFKDFFFNTCLDFDGILIN